MGVTAGSPPRQSEIVGGNLPAAAEAYLDTALIGQVHAVRSSAPRNTTLDAVARIFGARIEAEDAKPVPKTKKYYKDLKEHEKKTGS